MKFYQTLAKLKIKTKTSDVQNLNRFLRINDDSPDKFLLKKLTMVIEEFLRNHYLKSFGYKKKRLDDQAAAAGAIGDNKPINAMMIAEESKEGDEGEEEYYYDEEDDGGQGQG